MDITTEGVMLRFMRRQKVALEFDGKGGVRCTCENFTAPMQVSVCHFTGDGGLLVLLEPQRPEQAES